MSGIVIPQGFTREQLIACVRRELALRANVYPKRVADGRMTASDALVQQTTLKAVLDVLLQLPAEQGGLPGIG